MPQKTSPEIDNYIKKFPKNTQKLLEKMRATIRKAAPAAEEKLGYGIPTFTLHGNLVHFGGYDNHIGFYPGPAGIAQFKEELSVYKGAKGSVQFPIDQPLPLALITKIVLYRVKQNEEKLVSKKTLKKCAKGHTFYKSSDCPACPICEKEAKPVEGFLAAVSGPARRALENADINTAQKLSKHTKSEILALHGIGPTAIPKLIKALAAQGLAFKNEP